MNDQRLLLGAGLLAGVVAGGLLGRKQHQPAPKTLGDNVRYRGEALAEQLGHLIDDKSKNLKKMKKQAAKQLRNERKDLTKRAAKTNKAVKKQVAHNRDLVDDTVKTVGATLGTLAATALGRAEELVDTARGRASGLMETVRDQADTVQSKANASAKDARSNVAHAVEVGGDKSSQLVSDVKESTQVLVNRLLHAVQQAAEAVRERAESLERESNSRLS